MLHPPAADPGITDDERRTIAEMMAKGTYAIVVLATKDLDATFERLQAGGAEVVQEPIDQPYGIRDCAFRDPAGNHIRINEETEPPATGSPGPSPVRVPSDDPHRVDATHDVRSAHHDRIFHQGIKTVLHPVSDLETAKKVYTALLGVPPQALDSSYYVGYEAEGQHIGLVPGGGPQGMTSPVAYWHVPDIEAKLAEVTAAGATVKEPAHDVGGGRLMPSITDPDGNVLGLLQDR